MLETSTSVEKHAFSQGASASKGYLEDREWERCSDMGRLLATQTLTLFGSLTEVALAKKFFGL